MRKQLDEGEGVHPAVSHCLILPRHVSSVSRVSCMVVACLCCASISVMDIDPSLSSHFSLHLSNLPLCSFPLVILVYLTLIHYSYLLYLPLWFILPRVTHYYLYYIYFLNVSISISFFGKNQIWCCQTSLLGIPHGQHMFGAIPECPGM